MRACFIGNSFLVAIREGFHIRRHGIIGSRTFVAAPGSTLELTITPEHIVPQAAESIVAVAPELKKTDVEPSDYDLFVVVGLDFGISQGARVYRRWRLWKHWTKGKRLASRELLAALVEQFLYDTRAVDIARKLRAVTSKPIFIMPHPAALCSLKDAPLTNPLVKRAYDYWSPVFDDGVAAELQDAFDRAAPRAVARIGVSFLEQPFATRCPVFTKEEYRRFTRSELLAGRPRNNGGNDFWHMNAAFGSVCLDALVKALVKLPDMPAPTRSARPWWAHLRRRC